MSNEAIDRELEGGNEVLLFQLTLCCGPVPCCGAGLTEQVVHATG